MYRRRVCWCKKCVSIKYVIFPFTSKKKRSVREVGEGDQRIKDQTHEQKAKPTLCFFFSLSFFSAEKVETGFLDLNWQTQRKKIVYMVISMHWYVHWCIRVDPKFFCVVTWKCVYKASLLDFRFRSSFFSLNNIMDVRKQTDSKYNWIIVGVVTFHGDSVVKKELEVGDGYIEA